MFSFVFLQSVIPPKTATLFCAETLGSSSAKNEKYKQNKKKTRRRREQKTMFMRNSHFQLRAFFSYKSIFKGLAVFYGVCPFSAQRYRCVATFFFSLHCAFSYICQKIKIVYVFSALFVQKKSF